MQHQWLASRAGDARKAVTKPRRHALDAAGEFGLAYITIVSELYRLLAKCSYADTIGSHPEKPPLTTAVPVFESMVLSSGIQRHLGCLSSPYPNDRQYPSIDELVSMQEYRFLSSTSLHPATFGKTYFRNFHKSLQSLTRILSTVNLRNLYLILISSSYCSLYCSLYNCRLSQSIQWRTQMIFITL
jgi:hypothetical protein